MIKIGEFSKIAKTTIKTLRYYDDINLFKPIFVDENGYRYYELSQLNDLLTIINLRSLDLPIDSILEILNGGNYQEILTNHIKKLEFEKKRKASQISSIKKMLKGENQMEFKKELKEIESNVVYYRHGVIDSMNNLFNFVLEAGERCGKLNPGLKCKNYCYVTYTACEYKEKDVELEYVEACKTIGNSNDSIKFRVEPKIKALSIKSYGPYENLRGAYAYILSYIKDNNIEINGPLREVYIHGCWDKENEDEYLTEIQVPIK